MCVCATVGKKAGGATSQLGRPQAAVLRCAHVHASIAYHFNQKLEQIGTKVLVAFAGMHSPIWLILLVPRPGLSQEEKTSASFCSLVLRLVWKEFRWMDGWMNAWIDPSIDPSIN